MSERIEDILDRYLKMEDAVLAGNDAEEALTAFGQFQARRVASLKRRKILWLTAAVGAAACILLVGGLFLCRQETAPDGAFYASASAGEVVSVTLPDGTLVWLNASSSIRCSSDFGVKDRAVSLTGEGYFEVVKNPDLPMVVSTGQARVTVLGTRFDFRDYPEDAEASVILYEGHVSFSDAEGAELDLTQGQSALLDKSSGVLLYTQSDTAVPAVWKDGLLVFEDCTLERICRDLSSAYGIAIKVTDPDLLALRFTAAFNVRTQQLSDVLETLSLTRHLSFRITETGAEIF